MKAVLVRVGIDHSFGGWNAPADPTTREFVYVPIPEKAGTRFLNGCKRSYASVLPALESFARNVGFDHDFPRQLLSGGMHLDPDFEYLTYGDVGARRGSHIRDLEEDDLLIFYAGLRPCRSCEHKLIYALVGLYVVKEVVCARCVPTQRRDENAHTRKLEFGSSDIVVCAKSDVSGRLTKFISIGEYRDRAYRVRREILHAWGGLTVHDGYIQRSARPPRLIDLRRFLSWLAKQNIDLIAQNNPASDRVVIVHLRQP